MGRHFALSKGLGSENNDWATVDARAIFIITCGVFLTASPADASRSSDHGVLMLNPGYSLPTEPYADSKTHAATLGMRVRERVELGLKQTFNYAGIADAEGIWDREEIWRGRTAGFANFDWNSPDSRFVPFIGAFAGVDYDAKDASAFMGPHAGFSQYLDDQTFVRLRYRYEWSVDDIEKHDFAGTADQGEHILSLGLGVNF